MKNYKKDVGIILDSHLPKMNDFAVLNLSDNFKFLALRLAVVPNYGLVQGRELLKMISRVAFNDSSLTDIEAIAIMETCLDPVMDNLLLEVNFNAGW